LLVIEQVLEKPRARPAVVLLGKTRRQDLDADLNHRERNALMRLQSGCGLPVRIRKARCSSQARLLLREETTAVQ
jgi:hypothetical protein